MITKTSLLIDSKIIDQWYFRHIIKKWVSLTNRLNLRTIIIVLNYYILMEHPKVLSGCMQYPGVKVSAQMVV